MSLASKFCTESTLLLNIEMRADDVSILTHLLTTLRSHALDKMGRDGRRPFLLLCLLCIGKRTVAAFQQPPAALLRYPSPPPPPPPTHTHTDTSPSSTVHYCPAMCAETLLHLSKSSQPCCVHWPHSRREGDKG